MEKINYYYTVIFTVFVYALVMQAQDVDFSGYGAVGYIKYDRNPLQEYNQETYYEGKFQADIEFNDLIDAQLDFRGNSTDNSVSFREFSAKVKVSKYLTIKAGNVKVPFGYEQMRNRDELIPINRSNAQNNIELLGYGGRQISIMGYHKYDDDQPEFPLSYFLYLFRNNTNTDGLFFRGGYHFGDAALAVNFAYQRYSAEDNINTIGFGLDYSIEKKRYNFHAGLFFLDNPFAIPFEGMHLREETIYASGGNIMLGYRFDYKKDLLKKIEPFLLFSFYVPDIDVTDDHQLQVLAGCNMYIEKDARLRLNADLRMLMNEYIDKYSTRGSLITLEFQVRFED